MIYVDDRIGSKELQPIIRKVGIPCELTRLPYGDACFDGNGPKGTMSIGVERKKLNDMLNCIEDARYSSYQRPGMSMLYAKSFLAIEGLWAPGEAPGYEGRLMEGFRGGQSWGPLRTRHSSRGVLYSKLYRYLISIALSGVIITPSNGLYHTAFNICELYQYFQKKWNHHTSLIEVPKINLPDLSGKPSLALRWAACLDDVGPIKGVEAAAKFKTGINLAQADESDWMDIDGISAKLSRRIVKEIKGWR